MSELDLTGVSFDGIEDSKDNMPSFDPIPAGEYNLEFINVEGKVSSKGTYGLNFAMQVSDGEYKGRKIWKDCWLTNDDEKKRQNMMGMFAGFLEDCGVVKEERKMLFDNGFKSAHVFDVIAENDIVAKIGIKTFNGKDSNEFVKVISTVKKVNKF